LGIVLFLVRERQHSNFMSAAVAASGAISHAVGRRAGWDGAAEVRQTHRRR